ncbi:protein-L-isoaspartate O-methyltransferase [Algimonas ampicilliniresistens]|uniref:Protein-L-isoaspartate O-methyltransferase n=1 Tax=Algimonas ampicilliniresistens TaxID=1298735 RepID=A0ABQ5V7N9_9PROT|nr:protein-L-isoaspartate(D-aspartate) O-methyltransferase [Algimonas ampicilliniresistens]GLQ23027.1 protein-L-isoaspartate O-methyltransferase [Algimonas ampicilliniresistens]
MNFDPRLVDMVMRLRSRGISDSGTLRAMEQVPRKAFLTPELSERAYEEIALPIACGQQVSAPLTTALLVQMLAPTDRSKVLEIGGGSGWMSAVLSRLARRVYSVERYVGLVSNAETRFRTLGIHNVEIRHGDGRYGWPGQAPFDRIVLGCAVRAIPEKVMDQLSPNGRLVAVVDGTLTLVEKARKHVTETELMPLDLPMIEAGKSKTL